MAGNEADWWWADRKGGETQLSAGYNAKQGERGLYSESAQRASLGSALLENSLMRGPLASLTLTDFALSADRTIYALMLELSEGGTPFDPIRLAQILEERGQLEQVGGGAYLGSLIEGAVQEPGIVQGHVRLMQKLSQLRRLLSLAENLENGLNQAGADPDRLLQQLDCTIQSLKSGHDLEGHLLPVGPRNMSRRPDILRLSQVEPKDVQWLWEPYLPFGMLSMLSGDPGAGKTFIALAVAAAVTVGKAPHTGEPREPADVLYLSVENSHEHVLRPRFDSLGGDPGRFHILRGWVAGDGERPELGSVRLSDVTLLGDALQKTKARLLIVDPIQSYLGADVDAHRSNETRPVMDGLSRLAEDYDCCSILVRHLGKAQTGRAIHRGLGSIDLTGAVRTELLAGCSPSDPGQRAIVPVKSNLGQFGPSLGYSIEADGAFRWTGESQLTASVLLAPELHGEEAAAMTEAKDFLAGALARGKRLVKEIQAEAQQEGISSRTLKRAKKELRVRSHKSAMIGTWEWSLPEVGQE